MEICEELYVHSLLTRTFLPLQDFREADTIKVTHPLYFSVVPALLHLGKMLLLAVVAIDGFLFATIFQKKEDL